MVQERLNSPTFALKFQKGALLALLDIIEAAGVDGDSRDVFAMIEEDLREAGSPGWG